MDKLTLRRLAYKGYVVLFTLIIFASCKNESSKENEAYVLLNSILLNSRITLNNHNSDLLHSLKQKSQGWETKAKAEIWYPKAIKSQELTDDLCRYLDSIRMTIKKEAGIQIEERNNFYDNIDEKAVERLNGKGTIKQLQQKLSGYRNSMLGIDNELKTIIEIFPLTFYEFDTSFNKDLNDYFFKDKSALSAIASISSFEVNAKVIESLVLDFCNRKTPDVEDYYHEYFPLAVQSATSVKSGEKISISAGVGVFSIKAQPNIFINNSHVDLNTEGVAIYTFKSSEIPGKHYVPLSVEFTKPDGQRVKMQKQIEYTVAE